MAIFPFLQLFLILPLAYAFVHPGLLVSQVDINRVKKKLDGGQEPWLSSWNKLISLENSNTSYSNNAVSTIYRGSDGEHAENAELLWHDAAAAFNLALRWKVSGDEQYAQAAANILTAWGETLTSLGGNDDRFLAAGFQGHQLANAAELLRDYSPFMASGFETFASMMTTVFLPMNLIFLNHGIASAHNHKHFFANWELCNVASAMAIGVLTDNHTAYDFAVDYFKNGDGNGAIGNAITNIVQEPSTGNSLGQGQEAGRDQGHAGLDFQMLGVIGQQAYNQGDDLFGYADSRILLGAEYFARYNLGHDVPFVNYTNGIVFYTEISSASRGAYRPTWELLYNHYAMVKGLDAPWTKQYRDYTLEKFRGFEGGAGSWGEGSGHYDGLGWGSLLYRLEDSDLAGLNATLSNSTSTSTPHSTASSQASVGITTTSIGSSLPTTLSTTIISGASRTFGVSAMSVPASSTFTSVTTATTPAPTTTDFDRDEASSC